MGAQKERPGPGDYFQVGCGSRFLKIGATQNGKGFLLVSRRLMLTHAEHALGASQGEVGAKTPSWRFGTSSRQGPRDRRKPRGPRGPRGPGGSAGSRIRRLFFGTGVAEKETPQNSHIGQAEESIDPPKEGSCVAASGCNRL